MPRYKMEVLQGTHREFKRDTIGNLVYSKNKKKGALKESLRAGETFETSVAYHLFQQERYRLVCVLSGEDTSRSPEQNTELRSRDEHIAAILKENERLTQERDDALVQAARATEVPVQPVEAPPAEPIAELVETLDPEVPVERTGPVDDLEDMDMLGDDEGEEEEEEEIPESPKPPVKKAAPKKVAKKTPAKKTPKRTRSK